MGRTSRHIRTRAGRPVLWATALAVALAAPAVAAPYNPENLAPGDHAVVAGLCRNVVGLTPGNEQYDACLEALSASTRAIGQGRSLTASQADCLRRGLPPGSPALARCELDLSRTGQGGYGPSGALSPPPPRAAPVKSYWYASNAEIHRREETACAELGLEPVGGDFTQCVASLDASLFAADNPSH